MKETSSSRICGLDLIHVVAIFFVIAGHFFVLHTSLMSVPFNDLCLFVQATLKDIFCVGVPLFIMLTGYLNSNKPPTRKYYKGMLRVLVAYLVFSIITILFRKYYIGEDLTWLQWTMKILDYSAIPYAWYIEMWIGLALLTPFLNYMYKAIPSKNQKLLLLASLFVMTSLPDLFNRYGMYLVPAYFAKAAYPLLFYFAGTFIREYQPRIKHWQGWALVMSMSMVTPLFNIAVFRGNSDLVQIAGGPGGVFHSWIALAIFLMLYKKDVSNPPLKRWITHCSLVSLEMYLCCYMFDMLYYPWFKERFFETQSQFFPWFFVIVPLIFMSSYIVASIYRIIPKP